jgi:hypothetical protein
MESSTTQVAHAARSCAVRCLLWNDSHFRESHSAVPCAGEGRRIELRVGAAPALGAKGRARCGPTRHFKLEVDWPERMKQILQKKQKPTFKDGWSS